MNARIIVVDDDIDQADCIARILKDAGYKATSFTDPGQFLSSYELHGPTCVITDVMMDNMTGFELATELRERDPGAALIFVTGWPSIPDAVSAIRQFGGLNYLVKPLNTAMLLEAVREASGWSVSRSEAVARLAALTPREREVFDLLVQGYSNKVVASELGISPKTIEDHRASIMRKTLSSCVADLIAVARMIELDAWKADD